MELFKSEGYTDLRDVTLENEERHMLAVLGRRKLEGEKMAETAAAVEAPPQTSSPMVQQPA